MSKKGLSAGVKAHMVIWALFMPVCLIAAIWAFLPSASKDDDFDLTAIESQMLRTEPVGKVVTPQEESTTTTAETTAEVAAVPSPEETYNTVCAACHSTGLLDSPKFGDSAAWQQRITDIGGMEQLVASAIAGKGSMPPKGGSTLSDEDFAKVVAYISGEASQ